MRKILLVLLSLALTSSVGAQSCCDWDGPKLVSEVSSMWYPGIPSSGGYIPGLVGNTFTLSTESTVSCTTNSCIAAWMGPLHINGGSPSTTKTCSTSTCSISFRPGSSVTWANASTSLLLGIQGIDSSNGPPARPDGSWLNYATLVPGTESITASAWNTFAMETGGPTVFTHGQNIAITFDMTARGGADSVTITGINRDGIINPLSAIKTNNSWAVGGQNAANAVITFDDGTFGWIEESYIFSTDATTTMNASSTPDEACNSFAAPFTGIVDAARVLVATSAGTANFNIVFYSNPLTTRTQLGAISIDANQTLSTNLRWSSGHKFTSEIPVKKGGSYAICVLPTVAGAGGNISYNLVTVNSSGLLASHAGGSGVYYLTYTDGASAAVDNTMRIYADIRYKKISAF